MSYAKSGLGFQFSVSNDAVSRMVASEMQRKSGATAPPPSGASASADNILDVFDSQEASTPPVVEEKSNVLLYAGIAGAVVAAGTLGWFVMRK